MANTFTDNQSQEWTFHLTVRKTQAIKKRLPIDILNPYHYEQFIASLGDRLTYLYLLCEDQAKELGIGPDEFEERLYGGDVVTQASEALQEELIVFFQKLGQRPMALMAQRILDVQRKAAKTSDADIGKTLDAELEKALGDGVPYSS